MDKVFFVEEVDNYHLQAPRFTVRKEFAAGARSVKIDILFLGYIYLVIFCDSKVRSCKHLRGKSCRRAILIIGEKCETSSLQSATRFSSCTHSCRSPAGAWLIRPHQTRPVDRSSSKRISRRWSSRTDCLERARMNAVNTSLASRPGCLLQKGKTHAQ